MQRTGIAIAAEPMMQELGLDQVALGWLLTVFLIGYTAFQIPGGVLGEYCGPRRTLTWMGAASLLAGAIKNWLPARNWGFAQGFLITGA